MKFDILIKDLSITTIIGILPKERENPQNITLNLKAVYKVDSVFLQDSVVKNVSKNCKNLIDYAILRDIILDIFSKHSFFYLESALFILQKAIISHFPHILTLDLSIKKTEIFSDCVPEVCLKWKNPKKAFKK